MPYLITAGRAVCTLCGHVLDDERWQTKAAHDREHVERRAERGGGENR